MPYALALALTLSVAMPLTGDYVPAGFLAYSEDLEEAGFVNGRMNYDRLLSVQGCLLERDAAYMFALMVEAAEEDGMRLGTEDCYRSFNTQKWAWESRCPYTDVAVKVEDPDTGEDVWGTRSARKCSGPPIARAGESNHGWGRAIDFADRYGVLSCRDPEFLWLQANGFKFGWVHPPWAHCGMRTEEAWHWEWAGVIGANLVPDYAATWVFADIPWARIAANLEEPVPLPVIGFGDSEYVERWREEFIDAWRLFHLADD
jgi:hypothetical protein